MAMDIRKNQRGYKVNNDTVEDLESELQEVLLNMDTLAQMVQDKELDAYEGFMQSEKYKNRIVELGNALKAKGIDITTRTE